MDHQNEKGAATALAPDSLRILTSCGARVALQHCPILRASSNNLTQQSRGSAFEGVNAWFDGACWPNQGQGGHGGYGVIIRCDSQVIFSESVYMGHDANLRSEVCEYAGIISVFHFFLAQDIHRAIIHGDSQTVIEQLDGLARARRGVYLPHYHAALRLRGQLPEVRLVWIPRRMNNEANALSRKPIRWAISRNAAG